VQVGGVSVINATHEHVVQLIKNSTDALILKVIEASPSKPSLAKYMSTDDMIQGKVTKSGKVDDMIQGKVTKSGIVHEHEYRWHDIR
jgi:hypothetical protein